MASDAYIPDQTYTYNGEHYWEGEPMPRSVAVALGLVQEENTEEDTEEDTEEGEDTEAESDTEEEPRDAGGIALPEGFPFRDKLADAGITTLEGLGVVSDEALDDNVKGIGPARIETIREAERELRS